MSRKGRWLMKCIGAALLVVGGLGFQVAKDVY